MELRFKLNPNILEDEKVMKLLAELTDPNLVNVSLRDFELVVNKEEQKNIPTFMRDRLIISKK